MDRVHAGLDASRAHLEALEQAIDAITEGIGREQVAAARAELHMPEALAAHAVVPQEAVAAIVTSARPAAADAAPAPPEAEVVTAAPASSGAALEAARLVAIEMAVAGDTREVVGRRLREEFGLGADARQLLDDVYGPQRNR